MRERWWGGSILAVALIMSTACGSDDPAATPAMPSALSCPVEQRVSTDGGDYAKLPDGFETRERAVESWLASADRSADDFVLTDDGEGAWILQTDGTVVASVSFLPNINGFYVHGYEACRDWTSSARGLG